MSKQQRNFQRHSIRMTGYNYSLPGYYYLTINADHKAPFFGEIINGEMHMNSLGQIAQDVWLSLPKRFSGIEIDQHIIMPNHVHGIVILQGAQATSYQNSSITHMPERFQSYWHTQQQKESGSTFLYEIVRTFKAAATYRIRREGGTQDFGWQRNYYERAIRNEQGLYNARLYILNNPIRWEQKKINHRRRQETITGEFDQADEKSKTDDNHQ